MLFTDSKVGGSYNIREWDGSIERVVVEDMDRLTDSVTIRYPDGQVQCMLLHIFEDEQIICEV